MSTELKPCPFCGGPLKPNDNPADFYVRRYGTHYQHPSNLCFLDGCEVSPSEIEGWNRRAALDAVMEAPKAHAVAAQAKGVQE